MSDTLLFFAAPVTLTILLIAIHAYLGLHVIEREVIFVDISLSQIAALGVALAELFFDQEDSRLSLLAALGLCLIVSFCFSLFRKYEKQISQEAIIGITYALASGALVLVMDRLPHGAEHLKEALIGNILFVTWPQVIETAIIYGIIGVIHYVYRQSFWNNSRGLNSSWLWDFIFYFLFSVVITFSTHHAGVLVVFAILVAPAALAHRFCTTITHRLLYAWIFGLVSCLVAFYLSYRLDLPAGATIVTTIAASFFAVLVIKSIFLTKPKST